MQPPIWIALLLVTFLAEAPMSACSAALDEISLESLRRQAAEGEARAQKVLRTLSNPTVFLRGVALWRMLCMGTAGAAAWSLALVLFPGQVPVPAYEVIRYDALAAGKRTLFLLLVLLGFYVVTWLLPRRIALNDPLGVLRSLCPVLLPFVTVVRPVTGGLAWLVRQALRCLGIDPAAEGGAVSEENIRLMMDIGEERGAIDSAEKEMIENVFDFNDLAAEDVMIHRTEIVSLWVEDTDEEIARTIEESGLSRFPVYDEDLDDVIGVLFSRDYFLNARKQDPVPLRELLRKAYFVPESVPAGNLFRDMQSKKIHLAIVVDEYGGTSGLITMEDLLEEIVGKIYDEFDPQDEQEIIRLGENQWRVAGSADLDDVAEALEMDFPEDEEAETLGGLVFAQLSVIPEDGSCPVVDADGLHIQVEQLSERRVEWALVSKLPPQRDMDND